MDPVVVAVASYAVFVIPVVAAWVWWRVPATEKVPLAAVGVLTLALAAAGIALAAMMWTDPRPFVVDGHAPLFTHAADNGFPSDHTTLGAAIAAAVIPWRRRIGALLLLLAALVGASRVAAHVHHVPDVIGGLLIGVLSAVIAVLVVRAVRTLLAGRATRAPGVDSREASAGTRPAR